MIRRRLTYLFILTCIFTGAQNVTLNGLAHEWYKGKNVELWQLSDMVTMNRVQESADTVRINGQFTFNFHVNSTVPVYISCENYVATFYVQPGSEYTVTLPEPDEDRNVNEDVELPINLGIIGADPAELNALIFDFQRLYNSVFIPKDGQYLNRAEMFRRADSLQKLSEQRYGNIENPYFRSYVTYFIASVNAAVSRGERYLLARYILGKPVQYQHYEYMRFFKTCFSGHFKTISTRYRGQTIYNIINNRADYALLDSFLRQDKILRSDSLRELVALVNLWDSYFSAEFNSDAIESLVSQLMHRTQNSEHKKVARHMLAYFGKLQTGSPAPDFSARTKEGRVGTLAMFSGRWVYLNFFSSGNSSSMREMLKIADLQKRYGHKMVFLSICLDDSLSAYNKFITENPKLTWNIWYNNDPSFTITAKEKYDVTGTEAYFLISSMGDIAQNPALAPSEGIEYKFNVLFRIRQRTHKTGIR